MLYHIFDVTFLYRLRLDTLGYIYFPRGYKNNSVLIAALVYFLAMQIPLAKSMDATVSSLEQEIQIHAEAIKYLLENT